MTALLTWNGIPPTFVGEHTSEQKNSLILYASDDRQEIYPDWRNIDAMPSAMHPFARTVAVLAKSFTDCGAKVYSNDPWNKIELISRRVEKGGTTYSTEPPLHTDLRDALDAFRCDGILHLRVLSVSSAPPQMLDLTACPDMQDILNQYRIDNHRSYRDDLVNVARERGKIVCFGNWGIGVFDAGTPHLLPPATESNQRIYQQGWIRMQLQPDLHDRILRRDVPRLTLG